MSEDPRTVHLADYQPYPWLVEQVELVFRLSPSATEVQSRVLMRPNPARPGKHDLHLDGAGLVLRWLRLNGTPIAVAPDAKGLTIPADQVPDGAFALSALVTIDPSANTALEGLYLTGGLYCTQCEAQGFRNITYYPDRPDVMAPFQVRLEGPGPVLLSNSDFPAASFAVQARIVCSDPSQVFAWGLQRCVADPCAGNPCGQDHRHVCSPQPDGAAACECDAGRRRRALEGPASPWRRPTATAARPRCRSRSPAARRWWPRGRRRRSRTPRAATADRPAGRSTSRSIRQRATSDRMLHQQERVVGASEHARDVPGGHLERLGAQHHRPLAELLECQSVVQTAR